MTLLSDKHVTNTQQLLVDVAADQAAKIDEISDTISDTDSDDDYVSESPILESFYAQGQSASIHQMTNFSMTEFSTL